MVVLLASMVIEQLQSADCTLFADVDYLHSVDCPAFIYINSLTLFFNRCRWEYFKLQMEHIVERMQDDCAGVSVKNVKTFMNKIPSVFTGICYAQLLRLIII